MNKKALEDSLAVWIVAILILAFLIFIFISVIGIKKFMGDKVPAVEITSLGRNDLFLAESFFGFLNQKTETGNTVREEIYSWYGGGGNRELVEKEFENYFTKSKFECSAVNIENSEGEIRAFNLSSYNGPSKSRYHQDYFTDKGMNITLLSNKNEAIKIRIYAGECKNGL